MGNAFGSSLGFIVWFVFFMFLISVFFGDKIATGLAALVLLSMVLLNSDRVAKLINQSLG